MESRAEFGDGCDEAEVGGRWRQASGPRCGWLITASPGLSPTCGTLLPTGLCSLYPQTRRRVLCMVSSNNSRTGACCA